MTYEYEDKLLDYASHSKTYEEYKAMSQELQEVYNKAKAFDTFLKYKEHVEKYDNSDCNELQNVFNFVMKELKEDKSGIVKRKKEGWDIYIDDSNNIMFISPNEKITETGINEIKKALVI